MKTLILMRHAKSSWEHPDQADFDRPLNDRGKKDAPEMGKRIFKNFTQPQFIVSSPAKRAIKTAKIIAAELQYPEAWIEQEMDLYEAAIHDILHIIRMLDDKFQTVMLVGHNPGFTGMIGYLTHQFIENLPTSGVAEITLTAETWKQVREHSGTLTRMDFPKNQ